MLNARGILISAASLLAASAPSANAQCAFVADFRGFGMQRYGSMLAFDSHRDRVVLYGGRYWERRGSMNYVQESYTDVWEWDGSRWSPRTTAGAHPGWNEDGVMVYDPIRRDLVAVGPGGSPATWRLDSTSRWQPITSTPAPAGRPQASIAFHSGRGTVMLFGGKLGTDYANDLWEWNGTTWTQIHTPTPPSRRYAAPMVYDAARDRLLVIGGAGRHPFAGFDELLRDTWEWDGTAWTQGPPLPGSESQSRFAPEFAFFDPTSGRVIVVLSDIGGTAMLERIGNQWVLSPTFAAPPANWKRGIAYDSARSIVVFQGGGCGGWCTSAEQYDVTLPGTPLIRVQPIDVRTCGNAQAQLAVTIFGPGVLDYTWKRRQPDGSFAAVADGITPWGSVISGATTNRLLITNIAAPDAGQYACTITAECGSVRTRTTTLTVCTADTTCDGTVDFFDYLLFVDLLAAEDPWADLDRNGTVDFFDYLDFMAALAAGC